VVVSSLHFHTHTKCGARSLLPPFFSVSLLSPTCVGFPFLSWKNRTPALPHGHGPSSSPSTFHRHHRSPPPSCPCLFFSTFGRKMQAHRDPFPFLWPNAQHPPQFLLPSSRRCFCDFYYTLPPPPSCSPLPCSSPIEPPSCSQPCAPRPVRRPTVMFLT